MLDTNGNVVSGSQTKYWPYGNARSATEVSQTDRRFTGQREEAGDPAGLGLCDRRRLIAACLEARLTVSEP